MKRHHVLLSMGLCAGVAWGLGFSQVALLSWVSALTVIVLLPACAAALWAESQGPGALIERAVYAFGGVAVSSWSLWGAKLLGAGTGGLLLAPTGAAVVLAALAPRFSRVPPARAGHDQDPGPARVGAVWIGVAVMVGLVAVPFLPHGWEAADGVHRMSMTDWYKHLSVVTALPHGGFPPDNPYLIDDTRAPYYYGFHLLAASLYLLAGGESDPFHVLFGLTLATAAAFPLGLYVLAQGLFSQRRCAVIAALGGSLLVGFDLVVWGLHAIRDAVANWPLSAGMAGFRALVPSTHLDFWIHHNERQFNPPYITAIWAPQHLAAVVIALLVVHMLRPRADAAAGPPALLPVLLLATMPAMSAYVAVSVALGVGLSLLVEAAWQRAVPWRTEMFRRWAPAGAAAGLLALPVLWVLTLGGNAGGLTLAPSSAGGLLNGAVFSTVLGDTLVARLLDTPALYLVEFGVIGWLALISIRDRIGTSRLSDAQRHAVFIILSIVLLVTFVRPPVGGPNNLYARPMVLVWSLLACFAADAWSRIPRRRFSTTLTAVCAAGTVVAMLGATAEGLLFGAASRDTVEAARWINARTESDVVVAFRPANRRFGYWLRRRVVAADRRHALLFGATSQHYDDVIRRLDEAYASPSPSAAVSRFRALHADVIVVDLPLPSWASSRCFEVGYSGTRQAVLTRSDRRCPDRPVSSER